MAPLEPRSIMNARWFELTRNVLPAMALEHSWPISRDHCFMRVCLDAVFGSPWHVSLARPAIRHMTDGQLADAIRTAETIVTDPDALALLNARSLLGRRRSRKPTQGVPSC